ISMNKKDIADFFDSCAPQWDSNMVRDEAVIAEILNNAGVTENCRVLDVACGTGVLIPDYLTRKVASITAVDISPEMINIAQKKFTDDKISFYCNDIETMEITDKFDSIVIYNAFPHFPDPENLIKTLSGYLNNNGILTVAHGMSRAMLDKHHSSKASRVSLSLPDENSMADLFSSYLRVTTKISNDRMYQVAGMFHAL
ncbi:MAG: class I SAM-dependent methyltransferase, partial [Bacillota bacterium]|nr:class I SAM-dependent methyltransferase [Bacillota bacterium]